MATSEGARRLAMGRDDGLISGAKGKLSFLNVGSGICEMVSALEARCLARIARERRSGTTSGTRQDRLRTEADVVTDSLRLVFT